MADAASSGTPKASITGLHHIGVPVNDLKRAVEFYTTILGMELKGDHS